MDEKNTNIDNKIKYVRGLKILKRIFEKHNITYWIDYGTLWGAMREGAIIDFDEDFDVGILLRDVPRVSQLKKEFKEEGYDLRINKNHLNYMIHKISTGEHLGCILFREAVGNYMIRICFDPVLRLILPLANYGKGGWLIKKVWKKIIGMKIIKLYRDMEVSSTLHNLGNLDGIEFYGEWFPVPEHPVEYLDWLYPHRNWRVVSDRKLYGKEIGRRRQRLKEVLRNG